MRRTIWLASCILLISGSSVSAEEIYTLDQAKAMSAQTGKLILLKFFKEG